MSRITTRAPPTHFLELLHRRVGLYLTPEQTKVGGQSVSHLLRSTSSDRPPDRVSCDREQQAERRGSRRLERKERVRGVAGEERPRLGRSERAPRQAGGGTERMRAEPRHQDGMLGDSERRREHVPREPGPRLDEGRVQREPSLRAVAETQGSDLERSLEQDRLPPVERMSQWRRRLDPLEAKLGKREAAEERRGQREGMNGGADIVRKAGEGELGRSEPASDGGLCFAQHGLESRLGKRDGRGETVRAGADDDGVWSHVVGIISRPWRGDPPGRTPRCDSPASRCRRTLLLPQG